MSDAIIVVQLDALMAAAHQLGFRQEGTRADSERAWTGSTDTGHEVRIRLEPRYVHGEGRIVVRWRHAGMHGAESQDEVRVTGRPDQNGITELADLIAEIRAGLR